MSERWVSRETFCALTGVRESTLYHNQDKPGASAKGKSGIRYAIISRQNKSTSKREYLLPETLDALDALQAPPQALPADKRSHAAAPVHYTPKQQAAAAEKIKANELMERFAAGELRGLRLENGREVRTVEDCAKWVAAQHAGQRGWSWKTIFDRYCKVRRAQGDGAVLVRKPRADRGQPRAFRGRPELEKFVAAKWIETGNISHVSDIVSRDWKTRFEPLYGVGTKPPSRAAIDNFLNAIPEPLRDYARLSKQKADAKHAPYIVTGRGEWTRPNECWVADHRLHDVLVANNVFVEEKQDAAVRVWQTTIQDMRSRVIVGIAFSANPSWRPIASALRQGISRFGKPQLFYCDNGKDFRKIGDGAAVGSLIKGSEYTQPSELDDEGRIAFAPGLLARLGITVSYCTPRHPQAKLVESFYSFVSKRFDPIFFRRGYTGSKPEQRSDYCQEAEKLHREFLTGKRRSTPLLPATEFIRLAQQWTDEFNAGHRHSGRGMRGKTPLAVMDELLPSSQRSIPDMVELAPLFWDMQVRKVLNCKVQIDNATYSAPLDDCRSGEAMFLANGTEVAVHRDPSDMAHALAFENKPSGVLLARLVCDELAAQQPITAEHVKAVSRERAKYRKAERETIDALTRGVPSEIEEFAQRATGTDDRSSTATGFASLPPLRRPRLQPAFVSDAVAQHAEIFRDVKVED